VKKTKMTSIARDILMFATFVSAWVAAVLGAMAVPVSFGGIVAIPLLALAVVGFIVFGGLLRPELARSSGRAAGGWVLIGFGGCFFVAAMFSIGAQFTGLGPQPPDIRRFVNLGAAMEYVFRDGYVVGFCIAGLTVLPLGAWLRCGGVFRPALLFVSCIAAYVTVAVGLQTSK
jgi:hypothetical protein